MIKTIKTTKQLRLDELIKYIFEEKIKADKNLIKYRSKIDTVVEVSMSGEVVIYGQHSGNELFPVEVEEPITEDTKFHILVGIYFLEEIESYDSITFYNRSIDDVRDSEALCIYALINEKLELIWERDDHGSN